MLVRLVRVRRLSSDSAVGAVALVALARDTCRIVAWGAVSDGIGIWNSLELGGYGRKVVAN